MGVASSVGKQFQHPRGWFGRVVARVMTRRTATSVTWTIDLIASEPGDALLEVGFGGGAGIKQLAARAGEGHVVGVDVFEAMIAAVSRRHAAAIVDGHIELVRAPGGALPFDEGRFDKACTINTVYVIQSPADVFTEMFRVLEPGGRAVVGFPDHEVPARARPRILFP